MQLFGKDNVLFKHSAANTPAVEQEVQWQNFNRISTVAGFVLVILSIIILFKDLFRVSFELPLDHPYWLKLFIHIGYLIVSGISLLIYQSIKPASSAQIGLRHKALYLTFIFINLYLTVGTTLVEQLLTDSMTIYIVVSLLLAMGFYLTSAASFILYASGVLFFILFLPEVQEDPEVISSHGLVAIVLAFAAWYVNRIITSMNYRQTMQLQTIQEQRDSIRQHNQRLRRLNEKLRQASNNLERVNDDKNEVLQSVAHDLKNPVNGITSITELIKMDPYMQRGELDEMVGHIRHYLDKMSKIIHNLVQKRVLDEGQLQLSVEEINISNIIEEIFRAYQQVAERKQITLQREMPEQEVLGLGDSSATYQVLDNLVSNALKFSQPNTKVTLRLQDNDNGVQIEIQDEGPGISDGDRKKLFTRYAQLSAKPTAGENSTGLGLSIVKRLVEGMGGTIRIKSEVGSGTTFIVSLPRKQEPVKA